MSNNQQNIPNLISGLVNTKPNVQPQTRLQVQPQVQPQPRLQAQPQAQPNPVIIPQVQQTGTISIFGQVFQKTHVYIVGLIVLVIIGYMIWTWYKKNQDDDDDELEDDDISYARQMQYMTSPPVYQRMQNGAIRNTQQMPDRNLPHIPQYQGRSRERMRFARPDAKEEKLLNMRQEQQKQINLHRNQQIQQQPLTDQQFNTKMNKIVQQNNKIVQQNIDV